MRAALLSLSALALAAGLAGCSDPEARSDSPKMTVGVGTPVPASAETEAVATQAADAADDPEIWIDPANPARGLIFGTDKKAGLYTYDLSGKIQQFLPEGKLNNVDLRGGFMVGGKEQVLVAASDRIRGGAALFLLDPASLKVAKWGDVKVPVSEPYGMCLGRRGEAFVAIVVGQAGDVRQVAISEKDGQPVAVEERQFQVGSQAEGCVIDDRTGRLYIGEEAKGVWQYDLDPATGDARAPLAAAPSPSLKPDVEGLTLITEGAETYLIASSQGDSAFPVWRVDGASSAYKGRFSVVAAHGVDAVTGTDGLAAHAGPAGPYARGLLVIQDDVDTEGEGASATRECQNFKFVDWAEVRKALKF
jgi:3-phytase